jgi:hypothetical protein
LNAAAPTIEQLVESADYTRVFGSSDIRATLKTDTISIVLVAPNSTRARVALRDALTQRLKNQEQRTKN